MSVAELKPRPSLRFVQGRLLARREAKTTDSPSSFKSGAKTPTPLLF